MIGSGKIEKDDPTELADTYHFKASLNAQKFLKLPGAGAFIFFPPLSIATPIFGFLQSAMEPEKEADIACGSVTAAEDYVIELLKR